MRWMNNLQHLSQATAPLLSYADPEAHGSTKPVTKQEGSS